MAKDMSEHGAKTRAGRLLSNFIRQIAEEQTEMITGPDGEDKMATKAEALARLIWKKALGYKEITIVKEVPVETTHHPDRQLMGLLFDRMEGRAPLTIGEGDEKITTAERVSEQGKKRIAEAGDINDNGD